MKFWRQIRMCANKKLKEQVGVCAYERESERKMESTSNFDVA